MGYPGVLIDLNNDKFQQTRPQAASLRTFARYVSPLNGSPFGLGVNIRLGQTNINGFTTANVQQDSEQNVSVSN